MGRHFNGLSESLPKLSKLEMKIRISKKLGITPHVFIQKCGYNRMVSRSNEISYAKRIRGYSYPRFHVYLSSDFINLHLDQKKPSYGEETRHSGEYDSEIVKEEANRIEEIMEKY